MKITKTFRRNLKTSRRFVFENVFDLDHVCVLHKRWFRHLRIIKQTPEYLEYRLQSRFYGLKQDTLVRGAPIDHNHYWYEFLTPLAKMRVEGSVQGADGDLTLTEVITYNFHWVLTPLFLLLGPLFERQKRDILFDDSRLLERVHQLNQAGFKRREMNNPRIVVYGGTGFFGRLLVKDLLEHSDADILIASRNPAPVDFHPYESRVRFIISDINDYESVVTTIQGANAAICCSGPFQGLTLNLLRACIEKGVHYLDVADDRDYVVRCHDLSERIKQAGIIAFVGCSVVPGISSLLTKFCAEEVGTVETTRIFITPGTRHTRGPGSFLCLLSTVGQQYSIPAGGKEKLVRGWTEREKVEFPPPIGERWVYFVVDIADYFLQPVHFRTQSVEFKIGSELEFLNRMLTILRLLMGYIGMKRLKWFLPFSRMIVSAASWFGTSQGAVMVEVSGGLESGARRMSLSVYAEENGEVIPSVLASIAVRKVLNEEVGHRGIVPLHRWLSKGEFVAELSKRDIKVVCKKPYSDNWELFSEPELAWGKASI